MTHFRRIVRKELDLAHDQDSTNLPPDIAAETALREARALMQTSQPAAQLSDRLAMLNSSDAGLRGEDLVRHWDMIGKGDGGFYDDIRQNGCWACGSHTPGCCDACA